MLYRWFMVFICRCELTSFRRTAGPRRIGSAANATLLFVATYFMASPDAAAQNLDRITVAREIHEAERLRACYRIRFEGKFDEGQRPPSEFRRYYDRLSDGNGRVRREDRAPKADMYGDTTIAVWSADEATANKFTQSDRSAPQLLSLMTGPPDVEHRDEIEISLGLRFFDSPRRPSEVIGDRKENVIVRTRETAEGGLVEAVFIGPSFSPSLVITHVYDPARQWALVEMQTIGSMKIPVEHEDVDTANTSVSIHYEMSEWRQSTGVWVPTRIHDRTVFRPGTEREEAYRQVTELTSVEINPPIKEEDFHISTDNLPKGSTVTDARLGISYKIGEDVLYMDGHLNQLTAPVTQVITAEMLPEIMKDAVALVPPEAATLASVESGTNWWKWGGIGFFAAGAIALAAILWMRRRAAA